MDEHLDDETETLLKQQQEIDDQDFNLKVLEDDDGPIWDKSLEVSVGGFTGLLRQSKKFISALVSLSRYFMEPDFELDGNFFPSFRPLHAGKTLYWHLVASLQRFMESFSHSWPLYLDV